MNYTDNDLLKAQQNTAWMNVKRLMFGIAWSAVAGYSFNIAHSISYAKIAYWVCF